MNGCMAAFSSFLEELKLQEPGQLLSRFEAFHALLLEMNARLNLFSRSTPDEELWTKHFLDSLLPLKCLELTDKKVLDFGTGGGLPGIPLKLAVPSCRMVLLDSVLKKTLVVQEMVEKLELADCEVIWKRLEDYALKASGFDLILCRAVRLEERYLQPLTRLLAPAGRVVFYKAQELSDIAAFQPEKLFEADLDYGHRAVYTLGRDQLTTAIGT